MIPKVHNNANHSSKSREYAKVFIGNGLVSQENININRDDVNMLNTPIINKKKKIGVSKLQNSAGSGPSQQTQQASNQSATSAIPSDASAFSNQFAFWLIY